MSNDQFYRLEKSWTLDEWPYSADPEDIAALNEILPNGYHYSMEPKARGQTRIELIEYVGEFNPLEVVPQDETGRND